MSLPDAAEVVDDTHSNRGYWSGTTKNVFCLNDMFEKSKKYFQKKSINILSDRVRVERVHVFLHNPSYFSHYNSKISQHYLIFVFCCNFVADKTRCFCIAPLPLAHEIDHYAPNPMKTLGFPSFSLCRLLFAFQNRSFRRDETVVVVVPGQPQGQ